MATNRARLLILNHISNDDFEATLRGQANRAKMQVRLELGNKGHERP